MKKSVRYTLYGSKKSIHNSYDIVLVSVHNPRVPSGNEESAFDGFWKPGGQTFPGNIPEAVIDEVPWGEFTIRKLGGN